MSPGAAYPYIRMATEFDQCRDKEDMLVEDTREIGEKRDFHTKLPNQYLIKTLLLFNNKSENVVNSKNSNNTTQPKT